jgi:hypothetical protein
MKRALVVPVVVAMLAAVVWSGSVVAQDAEYLLKDYMPQTVGSKWVMKTTGPRGEATVTYEVLAARDINGQSVTPIVEKNAEGQLRRGSLESVTDENLTLFGSIFAPRGDQAGTQPVPMLYQPAAVFPGTLKVGQTEEAPVKVKMGEREFDVTIKLTLEAVETVNVPKGTFGDCLKLVYTTAFGQGEMKRTVWYANGVGMVKSEQTGRRADQGPTIGELTDYQLAQ